MVNLAAQCFSAYLRPLCASASLRLSSWRLCALAVHIPEHLPCYVRKAGAYAVHCTDRRQNTVSAEKKITERTHAKVLLQLNKRWPRQSLNRFLHRYGTIMLYRQTHAKPTEEVLMKCAEA